METLGQMGADSEKANGNAALESTYTCKINIDFPESEKEQRIILANIEEFVNNFGKSVSDLDFIRAKVLDENATEISLMEFEHLSNMDLRDLPWSKIKFEAVKLTRGSTILTFNLRFEKAPRNIEDVNVYRLMELFIKSAIENIQFIKSVDPKNDVNEEEGSLMFKIQADRITFEERHLEVVLKHVRGAIKDVLGAAGDLGDQEVETSDMSDQMVEETLRELVVTATDPTLKKSLEDLTPRAQRKLIKEISKMAEKDVAKVTFTLETRDKKNKARREDESLSPFSDWLFPFDFRKIDDLPEKTKHKIIAELTKPLPKRSEIWCEFLTNLYPTFTTSEINTLMGQLSQHPEPFLNIVQTFSDKGGTLGALLDGLRKTMENFDHRHHNLWMCKLCKLCGEIKKLSSYHEEIEEIQTRSFDDILASVYCPSPVPHIKSLQEFEEMMKDLKLKSNHMKKFSDIQDTLKEGDQLWICHERPMMQSYAHVVIIAAGNSFIHVKSPGAKLAMRSRAKISKEDLTSLQGEDLCFVVSPPEVPDGVEASIFGERAEVCVGIRLDYDAATSNCETFANAVLGKWGPGVQANIETRSSKDD